MLSEKEELELLELERSRGSSPQQENNQPIQGTGILGQPTNTELGGDLPLWKKAVLEGIPIAGSVIGGGVGGALGAVGGTSVAPVAGTVGGGIVGYKGGSAAGAALGRTLSDLLRRTESFGNKDMDIDDYVKRAAIEGTTDFAFSQAFDLVSPLAKKGINMLIGKTNNKVNEKAMHYIIENPEATLKPATKLNIEKYPSLIQQSGREAFDFFKNEKSVIGKAIGEIKEQAIGSEIGQAIKTTVKDEYDSVQNLIASNLFRNDISVSNFLKVLNKELGEQSTEEVVKKKTIRGVEKVTKTPIQKEIGLKELDDTYTRIVQSDGWKELMSKNSGDIQPGDRQVIEIVSSLKNRLYGMFDSATEGTKDYAIKRAKYRNLKEVETNFNMNNSDDVYAAFAQAVLPGNENKLDLLIDIFPKEIFDKNLATIVNMSGKKFTDYLALRGYAAGGGTGFVTETLSGLLKGLGKVAGAGMANPTKYEIGLGSKVLQKTTRGTVKTLRDLLKSGTKQVILNKEDN